MKKWFILFIAMIIAVIGAKCWEGKILSASEKYLYIKMATIEEIKPFSEISNPEKILDSTKIGFEIKISKKIYHKNIISDRILFPCPTRYSHKEFLGLMVAAGNPNKKYFLQDFSVWVGNNNKLYIEEVSCYKVKPLTIDKNGNYKADLL